MSRTTRAETLLEEARLLMPWYLTGQLSADETNIVKEALTHYPSLREEFAREENIKKLVCQDAHLLELSALDTTHQRLDNLLRRISRELDESKEAAVSVSVATVPPISQPDRPKVTLSKTSLFNTIKSWWDYSVSLEWLTPANAVLGGLLVCQLGVGVLYYAYWQSPQSASTSTIASTTAESVDNSPGGFELATSETTSNSTVGTEGVIWVQFHAGASIQDLDSFLVRHKAELLQGPKNKYFKVKLNTVKSDSALDQVIQVIRAEPNSPLVFIGKDSQS